MFDKFHGYAFCRYHLPCCTIQGYASSYHSVDHRALSNPVARVRLLIDVVF